MISGSCVYWYFSQLHSSLSIGYWTLLELALLDHLVLGIVDTQFASGLAAFEDAFLFLKEMKMCYLFIANFMVLVHTEQSEDSQGCVQEICRHPLTIYFAGDVRIVQDLQANAISSSSGFPKSRRWGWRKMCLNWGVHHVSMKDWCCQEGLMLVDSEAIISAVL